VVLWRWGILLVGKLASGRVRLGVVGRMRGREVVDLAGMLGMAKGRRGLEMVGGVVVRAVVVG
jgi:hypothetical protein